MKRILNLYPLLFVLLFVCCKPFQEVKVTQIESVSLAERTNTMVKVDVGMKINNPNNFRIKIKKSDLEGFLNGKSVGKVNITNRIVLDAKSEKSYTMSFTADVTQLMMSLPVLMITKTAVLNVKGYITAKVFIFRKRVPVDMKEHFSPDDIQF
jgi:LEA14-like dessication related protein